MPPKLLDFSVGPPTGILGIFAPGAWIASGFFSAAKSSDWFCGVNVGMVIGRREVSFKVGWAGAATCRDTGEGAIWAISSDFGVSNMSFKVENIDILTGFSGTAPPAD